MGKADPAAGMSRVRGRNILGIRLGPNDLQAATVRDYLCEMLKIAYVTRAPAELARPLVRLGMIPGTATADGDVSSYDTAAAADLIWEAIDVLASEPFRPPAAAHPARR
jgi:hypothetical protein